MVIDNDDPFHFSVVLCESVRNVIGFFLVVQSIKIQNVDSVFVGSWAVFSNLLIKTPQTALHSVWMNCDHQSVYLHFSHSLGIRLA